MVELAEVWRRSVHWRHAAATERRAYDSAQQAAAAVAELGEPPPLAGTIKAVGPILGCWWPNTSAPAPAAAAAEAVERLRVAAMHRPELVRHCRALVLAGPS